MVRALLVPRRCGRARQSRGHGRARQPGRAVTHTGGSPTLPTTTGSPACRHHSDMTGSCCKGHLEIMGRQGRGEDSEAHEGDCAGGAGAEDGGMAITA